MLEVGGGRLATWDKRVSKLSTFPTSIACTCVSLSSTSMFVSLTHAADLPLLQKRMEDGLICADTLRAGAFDQLKQNATKARIPFYGR